MNSEIKCLGSLSNNKIEEERYLGKLQSKRKEFIERIVVLLVVVSILNQHTT
jgi:hypothetical protein